MDHNANAVVAVIAMTTAVIVIGLCVLRFMVTSLNARHTEDLLRASFEASFERTTTTFRKKLGKMNAGSVVQIDLLERDLLGRYKNEVVERAWVDARRNIRVPSNLSARKHGVMFLLMQQEGDQLLPRRICLTESEAENYGHCRSYQFPEGWRVVDVPVAGDLIERLESL